MNIEELPEDSDSSDEDYVPEGKQEDVPSEVDSDGDPEDALSDEDATSNNKKRKRKTPQKRKRQKKDVETEPEEAIEDKTDKPEEKKADIDDIWADFMKDTGFQSKSSASKAIPASDSNNANEKRPKENDSKGTSITNPVKDAPTSKQAEKVKVTQIFQFAGEEVAVEKEVSANSAEARLLSTSSKSAEGGSQANVGKPKRGGGLSGIGSVLSQLSKKPKISTLEKTKLDWDRFKKEENIEEELQTYNKGRDGYLERQDFLQRADQRRFEIEKEARTIERNKRINQL